MHYPQYCSLKPESLCVLTALCTDSSGGQWEDLYWAHPLHWEKPLWADTTDQRSGKASSESSWRTTGATGAGDQWSEEERRWAGAAFTHTGSHPVPAGNTDLEEQGNSGLEQILLWQETHRETFHDCKMKQNFTDILPFWLIFLSDFLHHGEISVLNSTNSE